jgi:hypothetical protein
VEDPFLAASTIKALKQFWKFSMTVTMNKMCEYPSGKHALLSHRQAFRFVVLGFCCLVVLIYNIYDAKQREVLNRLQWQHQQNNANTESSTGLPPVHINSTWIGNQWIPPPGYKLYSTREIQQFFQHRSVLFVGDSTARRQYGTFYGILNATSNPDDVSIQEIDGERVVDVNQAGGTVREPCPNAAYNICRPMPQNATNQMGYMTRLCLSHLLEVMQDEASSFWRELRSNHYSVVIFSVGPWELMGRAECGDGRIGRKNQTEELFRALFERSQQHESTNFVWRTWGSPGTSHASPSEGEIMWKRAHAYNQYTKQIIDGYESERRKQTHESRGSSRGISYIDWGQAMLARLFPQEKRIVGDIDPHYGLEARLTFVQMLINHLVERERQTKQNSVAWKPSSEDEDKLYHGIVDASQANQILTTTSPREMFTSEVGTNTTL